MDNFEYSIQINDRDWEEFYSAAEECGLMQVALATEEELLLSDTEREDTTYSETSSKLKFIRVSLCPPEEEHPLAQGTQPVVYPPTLNSYNQTGPSDDVLSGSEDEDIGSVTRFLCQREHLLCKKKVVQHSTDIPFPKQGDDYCTAISYIDKSIVGPMSESLAGQIKTCHYEVDTKHHTANTTTERCNHSVTFNGEVQMGHPSNGHEASLEAGVHSCTTIGLLSPNDSEDCAQSNRSCLSINKELQLGNNQNSNKSISVTEIWQLKQETTLPVSLGQNAQVSEECENYHLPRNDQLEHGFVETLCSKHNSLLGDTSKNVIKDRSLQVAIKAIGNSSAVQQNIPIPIAGNLELHSSKSHSAVIASNATGNTHETNTVCDGGSAAGHATTTYSREPISAAGQSLQNRQPPKHLPSASRRDTALTLPEMYDFFFDDFSDKGIAEPETHMTSQDGIMYTPDMYEYFFVEDNEESRPTKNKHENTREVSSTDLAVASNPSEAISWPEAYEFFFADGPQDPDRKGLMFSIPPSQAVSSADVLQSFVPGRLKGFRVRGTHHRRTPDTRLFPQEGQGAFEETNLATGSLAEYLSPSRSDACLVFLAFASWAVKTSDMQSADGWKTALLANIGAVSAIRYLRRRSRRVRQESSPQPGDET